MMILGRFVEVAPRRKKLIFTRDLANPASLRLRASLHESRDEFHPGMKKISFYMSVFIPG